jgi:hypothetical protein
VVVDPEIKDHNPPPLAGKGEFKRANAVENPKKKAEAEAMKPLLEKYGKYFPKPTP